MRMCAGRSTLRRAAEEAEKQAYKHAGCKFNLLSSPEVSNILFKVLKLPVPANAKALSHGKGYSTGAAVSFHRHTQKTILECS